MKCDYCGTEISKWTRFCPFCGTRQIPVQEHDDEPAFAPAWNNLALALFEQERFQEAAEALKKAEEGGFEVQDEFKKEVEAKAKA